MSERHSPVEILLVEDNPGDVDLVCDVLAESRVANHVSVAVDGAEALAFLRREGAHEAAPAPDLVLLDLNIPKLDGREILREVKADPRLAHIPVVVLTSSEAERDLEQAYRLHATCFMTKPAELEEFLAAVRAIEAFWLTAVRLPPRLG